MVMKWMRVHPRAHPEMLGYIPGFLSEDDPRSAKEQIDANYISGWNSFAGFTMADNGDLLYPDDPPTKLLFIARFRNEWIMFYQHSWLAIRQDDGSFDVARLD